MFFNWIFIGVFGYFLAGFLLVCFDVFQYSRVVSCLSALQPPVERRGSGYLCSATPSTSNLPPPPPSFLSFRSSSNPGSNLNRLRNFAPARSKKFVGICIQSERKVVSSRRPLLLTSLAECSSAAPRTAPAIAIDRITLGHIRPPGGQNKVH